MATPLDTPQEVLTSKYLKAAAPLDAKIQADDFTALEAIPIAHRYPMMKVDVIDIELQYILDKTDLTNAGWKQNGGVGVQSVNGDAGPAVVLKALDIGTDPIGGMSATQTQEALEQLKAITDGLTTGSRYLGAFDPSNPPTPQPQDGDITNFNQGDFFQATVAGNYDFDQAGAGRVVAITVSDIIRANISGLWDVIPFGGTLSNTDELPEGATNLYYTEGRVSANTDVAANTAAKHTHANKTLLDTLTDAGVVTKFLNEIGTYTEPVGGGTPLTDTDDLSEGAINFYYTEARVTANAAVTANTTKVSASGSIDTHSDVDITTVTPVLNDVLKWDGSDFVPGVGAVPFTTQTINHSVEGTLNIDLSLGVYIVVNLTANVTAITFTTSEDGKYNLEFIQDVVGGRVISFAGFHSRDGAIIDYSVNASASSLVDLTIANGKNIISGIGDLITIT